MKLKKPNIYTLFLLPVVVPIIILLVIGILRIIDYKVTGDLAELREDNAHALYDSLAGKELIQCFSSVTTHRDGHAAYTGLPTVDLEVRLHTKSATQFDGGCFNELLSFHGKFKNLRMVTLGSYRLTVQDEQGLFTYLDIESVVADNRDEIDQLRIYATTEP